MILLFFDSDPVLPPEEGGEFTGPDTTVTWANLLRESKLPIDEEEPTLVGANNYFDRLARR